MLLTIFNLPDRTRYQDIKTLLKEKCGLTEFILDNLTGHTENSKQVTVGLPEEEDAALLMRKLNGHYHEGYHLRVEPVKKKVNNDDRYKNQVMSAFRMGNLQSNQQGAPGIPMNQFGMRQQPSLQQPALQQPYYQQAQVNMNYHPGYGQNNVQQNQPAPFSYGGGRTNNQNVFANYGHPQQMASQSSSQPMSRSYNDYNQEAPLGFGQLNTSDVWLPKNSQNSSGNAPARDSYSQQRSTRWAGSDKDTSRSRDPRSRDRDRNTFSNSFSRDSVEEMRRPPLDWRDRSDKQRASQRREPRDLPGHDRGSKHPPVVRRDLYKAPKAPQTFDKHVKNSFHPSNAPKNPQVPRPSRTRNRAKEIPKPQADVKPKANNKPKVENKQVKKESGPPAKRPREESTNSVKAEGNKFKIPKREENPDLIPARAATWRAQLASTLAKEILNDPNNKTDLDPELLLIELKTVIRSRLATLVGSEYDMRMQAMTNLYRSRYNAKSDKQLFKKLTANMKKLAECVGPLKAEEDGADPTPEQPVKESVEDDAVDVNPMSVEETIEEKTKEVDENAGKYKSLQDWEHVMGQLKPDVSKAIDDELDEMFNQVLEVFKDEPEEKHKNIQEQIKNSVINNLKHVLKVNFAKRYLNIQPIVMRIFATPRISKTKMAPALEAQGVTNLCKTSKCLIGTCGSYDDLDRLCAMEGLVVEGSTIVMKPYHLAGKKDKVDRAAIMAHRQAIADVFTRFAENLFAINTEESAPAEDNAASGDGGRDDATNEGLEQPTEPATTNVDLTENDSNSQSSHKSLNEQDSSTAAEVPIAVKEESDHEEASNGHVKDSNDQNENNNQEESNINPETDPTDSEQRIDLNATKIVEEIKPIETSEENQVNIKEEPLNQSIETIAVPELDEVKNEDEEYPGDDIDMDDLNEDDLEDW
ncbi:unnamed protein product [Chrysodeixis includens]|uniref:Uncharacterized protein n=1 Tax=Chrysodeixis includens TaxID=689277 RepID=A0A9P0FWM4_CHRIL|nr:unnamed protein product [Chrysodeixis includens]